MMVVDVCVESSRVYYTHTHTHIYIYCKMRASKNREKERERESEMNCSTTKTNLCINETKQALYIIIFDILLLLL